MPLYNRAETLEQTIASLQNQSYPHWRLIIVDDNSTDNSVEMVKELMRNDSRIQLIESPFNQGSGPSRNIGVQESSTRYIAFMDSDDIWAPEKLSKQLEFMQENNSAFTYTDYRIIDENNQTSPRIQINSTARREQILANNYIVTSSVMLDTQQFSKIEFPDIRTGQDLGLWVTLLREVENAHLVPEELTYLRKWSGSISGNKLKQARNRWRIIRDIEDTPLPLALYYFAKYATLTGMKYAFSFKTNEETPENCEELFQSLPELKIRQAN